MLMTAPATDLQRNAAIARLAGGSDAARVELLGMIADGSLTAEDLFVVFPPDEPKRILAAMLAQRIGDAHANVLPPMTDDDALADLVAMKAIEHLERSGVRVVQSLNRLPSGPRVSSLEAAGLNHITELVFLNRDLLPADAVMTADLELIPAQDDRAFIEAVAATYEGTLDVPELNGTQSLWELSDSLRLTSKNDTSHWYFAVKHTSIVGVVQLVPEAASWELAYMGLLPHARGKKMGKPLVTLAVWQAARLGGNELHLHYDRRNARAENVYAQLGFRELQRRGVWLKIFPRSRHVS